jgi:chloramphenicol 3-O-phosphotransferase
LIVLGIQKVGKLILINGTSSAGKSSTVNELQNYFPDYHILKVDDWFALALENKAYACGWRNDGGNPWIYLHEYRARVKGSYCLNAQLRAEFFPEVDCFYQQAKMLARKGYSVILDAVLEYEQEFATFFEAGLHEKIIKILIYCPLDLIEKRVASRNFQGIPEQVRFAFSSFEQFSTMFQACQVISQYVIDVIQGDVIAQSLDRAADIFSSYLPNAYMPLLESFQHYFINRFKLTSHKIYLAPVHRYDLIINSGLSEPHERAQLIAGWIGKSEKRELLKQ